MDGDDATLGALASSQPSDDYSGSGAASWATNHARTEPHTWSGDGGNCTGFASKALHAGGGLNYKFVRWHPDNVRDLHNWWRIGDSSRATHSYTWSAGLFTHLGYNSATPVTWTEAQPGDVVFYMLPIGGGEFDHTSIVVDVKRVRTGPGRFHAKIWIAQSDDNHRHMNLTKQLAKVRRDNAGVGARLVFRRPVG